MLLSKVTATFLMAFGFQTSGFKTGQNGFSFQEFFCLGCTGALETSETSWHPCHQCSQADSWQISEHLVPETHITVVSTYCLKLMFIYLLYWPEELYKFWIRMVPELNHGGPYGGPAWMPHPCSVGYICTPVHDNKANHCLPSLVVNPWRPGGSTVVPQKSNLIFSELQIKN